MVRAFFGTLITALLLFGGIAIQAAEHTKDSIDTVRKNLESKKAILIDVREKEEWDQGHLKAARLVPLSKLRAAPEKIKLPKNKIIYCHCRSGRRALVAADLLMKQGYEVRPLKQGFDQLRQAGFEAVVKEKP